MGIAGSRDDGHASDHRWTKRAVAAVLAVVLASGLLPSVPSAGAAPVGQGFNLNASDLRFILRQIKIAEQHAATATAANPCGTLLGDGPDQIPNIGQGVELPWGLRTVDGSCNNLIAGQGTFGTADQVFPRLVPKVLRDGEVGDPDGPGPAPAAPTSYTQTSGIVFDSRPRIISNLIVDQTAGNPAAVAAAGENPEVTPSGAFFIPNVAPDVGLSAPFNSWFTLFGQFFDHGLDLVNKGGNGSVFVPLQVDDPLFDAGDDGVPFTADDGPNFMVLTRATHSGNHEAVNQTSPFVDQSQTYTSHPSHQVFLREYENNLAGVPVASGRLITGPGDGMATWADVKAQAATWLGIALTDADVLAIPLLATDPYGRFIPGPNGYPQLVVPGEDPDGIPGNADDNLREGNPAAPVSTAGSIRTGHAFLDDIAHHAVPGTFDHDGNPATPRIPQTPDADPGTTDDLDPGTYDDEMLAAHFMAGDGRVNENIGLTAVHHVFHAEHNRLTGHIKDVITNEDPTMLPEWQLLDGSWNGERIFQAARFVTEMEYQHLVFEEFVRKVQPMVNPFGEGGTGYNTSVDPAIRAEFAHAVYRFGHSLLTESVDRIRPDGSHDDLPLLDAFLNPPAFMDPGTQTAGEAAGAVVRGMTRQVGNELDEFVTEALRNRLLGLPLDLPTINMTRARDTGIPGLNAARRAFYAASNNSALTPYESWADLAFSLKHPESLVNFVAAYGTHPLVTAETTLAGRRNAAVAIVHGAAGPDGILGDIGATPEDETADNPTGPIPEDAYAFMNSIPHEVLDPVSGLPVVVHTDWVSVNGITTTGVDGIDLWVGGLAEKQMVFGGLLGPTFNYVFEAQMEDLQDGDRFYYLSRTAGLNLLTQLEGNSFAELIQRNTDVEGLPADSFSRPDFIFNLAALGTSGPILDDPATEWNEAALLTRMPNGTIRYAGPAHVVFNGTAGNDRMWSSEGDDTLRGNDGNDWLQGGDGADNLIGGLGDDILVDLFGDDVLKGGDGNDALSSGQGFGGDLNQGGRGNDFIMGGNDATETFGGPGNDFIFGGDGEDTVFGDDGDDWIEGGRGPFNLLQGDNGAPFQDDPNQPGHDVLIGYGGESDYDSEGGDDIMLAGPGIQRSEGMLGFDWVTHKADPAAADSDMRFTGLLPPGVETNRDRFDLVESLSGWIFDDILRGDDRDAVAMVGHELNTAGIARILGLAGLLPPGATSFTGGNILLGGAGGDLIEGRGGDDLIDGDAWLNVRISVVDTNGNEILSVDSMAAIQAAVFAGSINPGQLRIVREILVAPAGTDVDIAVFSGPRADYDITVNTDGTVTVVHARGTALDGTDTLRNVELLRFADQDLLVADIAAPAPAAEVDVTTLDFGTQTSGTTSAAQVVTVTNTGSADLVVSDVGTIGADATSFGVTSTCATVAPGSTCTASVTFAPTSAGTKTAQLQLVHNAVGTPTLVELTGTGVAPPAGPVAVLPAAANFGVRRVGTVRTQNVRVTNQGPGPLLITAVTTTAPFSATLGNCPASLAVGRSCSLSVTFTPTAVGPVSRLLILVSNASNNPSTTLTGTGR